MIYILLSNERANEHIMDLQDKLIKFLRKSLLTLDKSNYKIIYCPKHIVESNLIKITNNDYIIWHPNVASNNLNIVKNYINSFVLLRFKTVMLQKLSERNPINENMALNHNFGIIYVDENYNDVTNDDWRLIVNPKMITIDLIIDKILIENKDKSKIIINKIKDFL